MNNPSEIHIKRITDVALMPDGTLDIGFVIDDVPEYLRSKYAVPGVQSDTLEEDDSRSKHTTL